MRYDILTKKKRKKKIGQLITVVFLLTIVILLLLLNLGYFNNIINRYKIDKLNYSKQAVIKFQNDNIIHKVLEYNKYSKTLDVAISSNDYIGTNFNNYLKIDYVDNTNFIKDINKLISLGYNYTIINTIYNKLTYDDVVTIVNSEYITNLDKYLELSYFKKDNLSRYITYYNKNHSLFYKNIVTYVNIGLDTDFYTNIVDIKNSDDLLVLCNKYNKLSSNYIPTDLVSVNDNYRTKNVTIKKVAYDALLKMLDAAKLDNVIILAGSGYRSYSYQNELYKNYVNKDGVEKADTYSARPGFSEHQTGLAIDLANKDKSFLKDESDEYKWLFENAFRYGYIIRYPEGKQDITGYKFEPWHVRYVGIEVSTYIHNNNLTLDEYIARLN